MRRLARALAIGAVTAVGVAGCGFGADDGRTSSTAGGGPASGGGSSTTGEGSATTWAQVRDLMAHGVADNDEARATAGRSGPGLLVGE